MNRRAISPKMMGAAVILVGLLVGGGGALYIGQAFADQHSQTPTPVTGAMTGTYTLLPISSTTVSDEGVAPYTVDLYAPTFVLTGGISGTLACSQHAVLGSDGVTIVEANAICTFTGTVTGGRGPGTMSVSFLNSGSFTAPTPEGSYSGSITFSQGTGGLRNIQSIAGTDEGVVNPPPPFNTATNTAGIYTGLIVYNNNNN
jgi:hypothetical protein